MRNRGEQVSKAKLIDYVGRFLRFLLGILAIYEKKIDDEAKNK